MSAVEKYAHSGPFLPGLSVQWGSYARKSRKEEAEQKVIACKLVRGGGGQG
jgi:hypothetical protein